jgi:hypothetical protein
MTLGPSAVNRRPIAEIGIGNISLRFLLLPNLVASVSEYLDKPIWDFAGRIQESVNNIR